MGITRKSKNKETQSPVLKIFKDIMQKENTDPEKVNLLREKQKDKKKRTYSESRSKSDQKTYDSSSTDRYNRPTKITVQNIQEDNEGYNRSRTLPFQNEKRESWWLWSDKLKKQRKAKSEDACSCVSCALKKIISSEYTCISCLFILFTISVVIIFFMVFQIPDTCIAVQDESGSKVQQMKLGKEKRQLSESNGYPGFTERSNWDSTMKNLLGRGFPGVGYAGDNLQGSFIIISQVTLVESTSPEDASVSERNEKVLKRENNNEVARKVRKEKKTNLNNPKRSKGETLNILDDMENGISGDLASILDSDKIIESRENSEKLKDFFKELIQIDAKIRRLKPAINNIYEINNDKTFTDRYKRSLINKGKNHHLVLKNKNNPLKFNDTEGVKNKRSVNDNVTGIFIRHEKVVIQYEPDKRRNFPKCSHELKTNSHEQKMKHPFYKNSQRLDEMLNSQNSKANDDKTIFLTDSKEVKKTTKVHKKPTKSTFIDYLNYDSEQMFNKNEPKTGGIKNDFVSETDYAVNNLLSTSPTHALTLSISTFMAPILSKDTNNLSQPIQYNSVHRKLLQAKEENEELSYDDFKEVLADNQQNDHDDTDRHERKKRDDVQEVGIPSSYENNSSNIYNPNWKGPMPLYPDELNAMIRQAAMQNLYVQVPVNTKDIRAEKDKDEKEVSDTDYVEDYMDNKYNKMVKMAQAYSDYGVVYGKNDKSNDPSAKNTEQDQKYKLFFDKEKLVNRFFRRPGKTSYSEGFKIQIKPGAAPRENDLIGGMDRHVKIFNNNQNVQKIIGEFDKTFTQASSNSASDVNSDTTVKHILYNFNKASRSLKSVELDEIEKSNQYNNSNDFTLNNVTNSVAHFISMMSDWFKTLSSLSKETNPGKIKGIVKNGSDIRTNLTYIKVDNNTKENQDILYPAYDFNMVDNIGRRSRVLLSIEENSTISNAHNLTKKETNLNTSSDFEKIVPITLVLATLGTTNATKEKSLTNYTASEIKNESKNKTIVKRNIDKKVFWNDMYDDDEYGVKVDYIDGVRNKHSVDKGVIQKSKKWIKDKFKNITCKIKNKIRKTSKTTTRKIAKLTKPRPRRQADDNDDNEIKRSFADLTANMKMIFQQAAKEIQNTRNIDVRAENKDEAEATSLMQQLVRMMNDLVDIQVQQKTCAKLPADLHSFLEWLTVPTDDIRVDVDNLDMDPRLANKFEDGLGRFGKSTDSTIDLPTYNTEDSHQEDRTDCLGIIRSVQDLIQRYEEMTDEDKSKITGVKEYLEDQLKFLNTKVDSVNENNLYKIYGKRQVPRLRRNLLNNHNNGKLEKFMRNFGKKHTRSSPHTYDGVTITKNKKMTQRNKINT